MDWIAWEDFARAWSEPAAYAAFVGGLVVLGAVEAFAPRGARPPARARRWPANFALTVLNILVIGALPISGLVAADRVRAAGWGLNALDPGLAIALGLIARTAIGYAIHVAMHKVPVLWRVHRVHHGDGALDVSTTVRFHPLEFAISAPVVVGAIALLGIPPLAILLYEVIDAAMAVWTHANIRLPPRLARVLGWFVVTPDMHRVHHSVLQAETDSNFGAVVPWWDWLFGTYRRVPAERLATMELGLDTAPGGETGLGALLLKPFR